MNGIGNLKRAGFREIEESAMHPGSAVVSDLKDKWNKLAVRMKRCIVPSRGPRAETTRHWTGCRGQVIADGGLRR